MTRLPCWLMTVLVTAFNIVSWFYIAGHNYWGNSFWPLEASAKWERYATYLHEHWGLAPLSSAASHGWDGQFYFYPSNDLFAQEPASDWIDSPMYRFGRVGPALVAKCLAWGMGESFVSPFLYVLGSLLCVSCATWALACAFRERGLSVLYVLPWVSSTAVQSTFRHGLVDAMADSGFILAFLAHQKRSWFYVPCMTLALLSRENYAIAACVIFCMTVWKKRDSEALWAAVPGLILLMWHGFLYWRFRNIGGGSLLAWPFEGYVTAWKEVLSMPSFSLFAWVQMGGLLFFVTTLGIGFWYALQAIRCGAYAWWPLIAQNLVAFCLGSVVMALFTFYLRYISLFFAFLPCMIQDGRRRISWVWPSSFLALSLCVGLGGEFGSKFMREISTPFSMPPAQFLHGPTEISAVAPSLLTAPRGRVEIEAMTLRPFSDMPLSAWFTPDYRVYDVKVTNGGEVPWRSEIVVPTQGALMLNAARFENRYLDYGIFLTSLWYLEPEHRLVHVGHKCCLPSSVAAGETVDAQVIVVPPSRPGRYTLRLALVQKNGNYFFESTNGEGFTDLSVEVP